MLSMFANFDFDWPPALLSLYHAFSLFNFNFDLLAPECSVSLNYETKWYIIQSLPVILVAGIAAVVVATRTLQWVQVKTLGRLPFGALSSLNLVDVCIGIFISGVFMLYFGKRIVCSDAAVCTQRVWHVASGPVERGKLGVRTRVALASGS